MRVPARLCSRKRSGAFTYIENVVATTIVALSFAALFTLNSQCLYVLNSGREALNASQALQDRMEQLRSARWAQVTTASGATSISTFLSSAVSSAAFLDKTIETIKITGYPAPATGSAPTFSVVRQNGAVTSSGSAQSAFATYDLVRIDVTLSWTAAPGNRLRSQQITTLWGENTR